MNIKKFTDWAILKEMNGTQAAPPPPATAHSMAPGGATPMAGQQQPALGNATAAQPQADPLEKMRVAIKKGLERFYRVLDNNNLPPAQAKQLLQELVEKVAEEYNLKRSSVKGVVNKSSAGNPVATQPPAPPLAPAGTPNPPQPVAQ